MPGYELIRLHGSDPVVVVCANKIDLEDKRVVETTKGREFAESIRSMYIEVSAKVRVCSRALILLFC